jgi:hypothetical protein
MAKRAAPKTLYSVHPGVAMVQGWIATLKDKTGRSFDEWIAHIKEHGPDEEKPCRSWLKEHYGLGTNTAWWLAERALGNNKRGLADEEPENYLREAEQSVDAMFAGGKAGLRPIYDELLHIGLALGDVKACPCKTIVPLYRNHVFAQLKPTTRTRLDLGLALKDTKVTGRLIDTGGLQKKDRITRRIPITALAEIDAEVRHWLCVAYDMDK